MVLEKLRRQKICAARMPRSRHEAHLRRHRAVGGFALHGAAGIVRIPAPFLNATRRGVHVAAQRAFVGLVFFLEAVEVVRQELLGHGDVDLPFRLLHHFFPARHVGHSAKMTHRSDRNRWSLP